jgi:uncharacterized membrane protein
MIPVAHIHPMLVHFPIVFFLTLVVLDAVLIISGRDVTGRSRTGLISTGLAVLAGLSALATFYFGGLALDVAEAQGFRSDVAETHEGLGTVTAIAFAVWAVIRVIAYWRNLRIPGVKAAATPAIELLGALLVTATAYYGGQLVYDLGVNVNRVTAGL